MSKFPAFGLLSGWSTNGRLACPVSMGQVKSNQLMNGSKPSFYETSHNSIFNISGKLDV